MFQLKNRALEKLSKYQLSPLLQAPCEKYICLACLDFDKDSYGYSITEILISERIVSYEVGTSDNPKQERVNVDLINNDDWFITVHNSEHQFKYNGLYQFYFLDRKLVKWGKMFYRVVWLSSINRVKAWCLLDQTDLYKLIVKIIEYQNEHGGKSVSPSTLVTYAYPYFGYLSQMGIKHPKAKIIEEKYGRLMDALVQSGDLSGGTGEIPSLPFDINPKIYLTHQELFTEQRRHKQIFFVAIATCFATLIAPIISKLFTGH
ncbi:hypothetical protein [Vibrio salinus]|uniref:hypothetical protein n=1 Tax=Vibrio salinus TaxID=2899784 RepID=UPI001E5670B6|nr:hypothetical protein [Vibrio salinus]MCE0495351.1 hypothetical protein [Vibrio salinus]